MRGLGNRRNEGAVYGTPSAVCPPQRFSPGAAAEAARRVFPRLRASPLRAASIEFAPVRRNRSGLRVGICRLQPRLIAGSSAAAFTRPGRPPLWIALTLGSRWSPRVKTTQLRLTLRDHWRWQMAPPQKVAPGHPPCHAFCACFAIFVHFFAFFPCGLQRAF